MISFNAIFYDNNNSEIADFNCLTLDIKHLNLKSGETYKLVLIPNFTGSPDLILSDESVKFILNDGSCETDTLADITLSDQQDGYLTYKLTLNSNADFWFNISIGELNMAIKIISSQWFFHTW